MIEILRLGCTTVIVQSYGRPITAQLKVLKVNSTGDRKVNCVSPDSVSHCCTRHCNACKFSGIKKIRDTEKRLSISNIGLSYESNTVLSREVIVDLSKSNSC